MEPIAIARLDAVPPRRHDHRVRTRSSDYGRLRRLDHLVVDDAAATWLIDVVCSEADVPAPRLRFHARRSPFTGATEAPRRVVVEISRRNGGASTGDLSGIPEHGALRLGRRTTLMTVAHELAHHIVNHRDPIGTASHGLVWVHRFDEAAEIIERAMRDNGLDPRVLPE